MKCKISGKEYIITPKENSSSSYTVNGKEVNFDTYSPYKNFLHILHNNKSYNAELVSYNDDDKAVILKLNNNRYEVKIKDETDEILEKLGINAKSKKAINIKAPMPGLVLDIRVKEGDTVKRGDSLLVLEAMKMENMLKAESPGKVKKVFVSKGQVIEKNQPLIEME